MKQVFRRILYDAFFRLSPLLILVLLELSLRFLGVGDSYRLFRLSEDRTMYELNPAYYQRYISAEQFPDLKHPEMAFSVNKPPQKRRIFLLADQTLFTLIPEAAENAVLNDFYGHDSLKYEIIQVAVPHGNSFSIRHLVKEIRRYDPDAALLLTGNNEFYGLPRKSNWIQDTDNYWGLRTYVAMKKYRFFQVLERFVYSKNTPVTQFPPRDIDSWAVTYESATYREIHALFTRNLRSITAKRTFPLYLLSLPVNFKHIPYRSDFRDKELSDSEFARECAILVKNADRFMLERWIQELQAWEPETAIYYYCMALIREHEKDSVAALDYYRKAVEMDVLRVRNAIAFNADIREISSRENVFLIDAEKAFMDRADGGLAVDRFFMNGISLNENGKIYFRELMREALISQMQP